MTENISHPSHYNQGNRKECIVEMQELFGVRFVIDFCVGNCYKYLYRRGQKGGNTYEQDTDKAIWYYNRATELAYENNLRACKPKLDYIFKMIRGDKID